MFSFGVNVKQVIEAMRETRGLPHHTIMLNVDAAVAKV